MVQESAPHLVFFLHPGSPSPSGPQYTVGSIIAVGRGHKRQVASSRGPLNHLVRRGGPPPVLVTQYSTPGATTLFDVRHKTRDFQPPCGRRSNRLPEKKLSRALSAAGIPTLAAPSGPTVVRGAKLQFPHLRGPIPATGVPPAPCCRPASHIRHASAQPQVPFPVPAQVHLSVSSAASAEPVPNRRTQQTSL